MTKQPTLEVKVDGRTLSINGNTYDLDGRLQRIERVQDGTEIQYGLMNESSVVREAEGIYHSQDKETQKITNISPCPNMYGCSAVGVTDNYKRAA